MVPALLLLLSSASAATLSTDREANRTCSYMCEPYHKLFMLQSRMFANIWQGPGHDWPEREEEGWLTSGPEGLRVDRYTGTEEDLEYSGGEEQQLQWVSCSQDCCSQEDGCTNTQAGLFLTTKHGTVTVGKKGVLEVVAGSFGGPSMWGPDMDKYNQFGKWWKLEFGSLEGYNTQFKLEPVYETFTAGKGFPYLLKEVATGRTLKISKDKKEVSMVKNANPKWRTVQWEMEDIYTF